MLNKQGGLKLYKLGIGDLNQGNIELIKLLIKNKYKNIEIIGIFSSGEEVVKMFGEFQIDILFINISISDINGIEVIRTIRQLNNKTQIIVISDYDSVDFAKEVIRLNVDDYIMEPINNAVIDNLIKEILKKIKNNEKKQMKIEKQKKIMQECLKYTDYSFIYSLLHEGCLDPEVNRYLQILNLSDWGYVMNIEFATEGKKNSAYTEEDMELIYKLIKKTISEKYNCAVGAKILNRIVIYISADNSLKGNGANRQNTLGMGERIRNVLLEEIECNVVIGIGEIRDIKDIYTSYMEALSCLSYKGEKKVIFASDVESKYIEQTEYLSIENKMMESIKFGKEETLTLFTDIVDIISPLTIEAKKNKILELLVLSSHEVRLEDGHNDGYIDYIQYFKSILELEYSEVVRWAYMRIENIIKMIRMNRGTKKSSSVSEAIKYMENHYKEGISLDNISRYIGISPQHFSKIFKDETGINYVDWLADLRISMAKKLLNNGENTIKEICFLVGYNDPNYFSRIFKKITGISPLEYSKGGTPEK
jgi:two-component system, response regulator YesN